MKQEYALVDADSHYYEVYDCFSRHIEAKYRDAAIRPVHPADNIGRPYQGDRRLQFSPSWPLDFAAPAGALTDYYMGKSDLKSFTELNGDAKRFPDVYQRADRLKLMDEQGIEATIMLPTLAVAVEHDIRKDVPALYANLRSFNRWVEEDWGYGTDGRIFSVPILSLIDPQEAALETRRLIEAGARSVYIRPGPVYGRSPADPVYDGVWSLLNEAEIPVIFHIGDCDAVLCELFSSHWGENPTPKLHKMSAFQWYTCQGDRAITDTLASMIFNNLFGRFPKLRMMTIELGSFWVGPFMKGIDKAYRDTFGLDAPHGKITAKPSELFREHVWVVPFFEEDVNGLIDLIGPDRVLFGSDYPHPEGLVNPIQFAERLDRQPEPVVRKVMRTNTASLLGISA